VFFHKLRQHGVLGAKPIFEVMIHLPKTEESRTPKGRKIEIAEKI
jgi:hypothetical protein